MASRRVSFRQRPVGYEQVLPLIRSTKDAQDIGISLDYSPPVTLKALAQIPTPLNFRKFKGAQLRSQYRMPAAYIENAVPVEKNADVVHYDLEDQDFEFLDKLPADQRDILSYDVAEFLLDRLDKLFPKLTDIPSPTRAIPAVTAKAKTFFEDSKYPTLKAACDDPRHVDTLLKYWIEKRKKSGKPLIYINLPRPDPRNTDPYCSFRPRDFRTRRQPIRTRRTKQETLQGYKKAQEQLRRAKELMSYIIEREKIKRQLLQSRQQVFMERRRLLLSGLSGIPSIDLLARKFRSMLPPMPLKRRRTAPYATGYGFEEGELDVEEDLTVQIPMLYINEEDSDSDNDEDQCPPNWTTLMENGRIISCRERGPDMFSRSRRCWDRQPRYARIGRGGRLLVYPSRRGGSRQRTIKDDPSMHLLMDTELPVPSNEVQAAPSPLSVEAGASEAPMSANSGVSVITPQGDGELPSVPTNLSLAIKI